MLVLKCKPRVVRRLRILTHGHETPWHFHSFVDFILCHQKAGTGLLRWQGTSWYVSTEVGRQTEAQRSFLPQ